MKRGDVGLFETKNNLCRDAKHLSRAQNTSSKRGAAFPAVVELPHSRPREPGEAVAAEIAAPFPHLRIFLFRLFLNVLHLHRVSQSFGRGDHDARASARALDDGSEVASGARGVLERELAPSAREDDVERAELRPRLFASCRWRGM